MGYLRRYFYHIVVALVVAALSCVGVYSYGDECPSPVQPVKQGQAAICDGYLFSPDAESKAYKASRLADLYKDENQILQERLNLYIQESKTLSQDIAKRDTNESLYRIIYFGLGVLVTGFVVRNIRQ